MYTLTFGRTDYAARKQTINFTTVNRIEKLGGGKTVTTVANSNNNDFIRFPP